MVSRRAEQYTIQFYASRQVGGSGDYPCSEAVVHPFWAKMRCLVDLHEMVLWDCGTSWFKARGRGAAGYLDRFWHLDDGTWCYWYIECVHQ